MKKKHWIILIIVVLVLGILWFFWCKLRSYAKNTYVCHQKENSCTAIMHTEYYYENNITCPICPTFGEYLIKWIESLDINGVPECCSYPLNVACVCGGEIAKNRQECACGVQPILD